jgi:hypothetical protein
MFHFGLERLESCAEDCVDRFDERAARQDLPPIGSSHRSEPKQIPPLRYGMTNVKQCFVP